MLYVEDVCQCIPPGNDAGLLTGWLHLTLSNVVLLKGALQHVSFRVCMWGTNQPQLFLPQRDQPSMLSTRYSIRASRAVFMKYLNDMAILLVEVSDPRNTKKIGNVIVNIKRYQTVGEFGQPVVSNFRERFEIVAGNKQRLGEVTLGFEISEAAPTMDPMKIVRDIVEQPSVSFREPDSPAKPAITLPVRPKVNEEVQVDDPTRYQPVSPNIPMVVPDNRETRRRNTQQQTSDIYQPADPARRELVDCNMSVELMRLRQDEAILLNNYSLDENTSDAANTGGPAELSVQFVQVKYNYKLSRPIDRLTVVYPQQSKGGEYQTVSTTFTAVRANSNSSEFNQSISLRVPQKSSSRLLGQVEVQCGQATATYPIDKLMEAKQSIKLILKKKDGSKLGDMTIKVSSKSLPVSLTAVLYIGGYSFNLPGEYSLRINSKQYDPRTVVPSSKSEFSYRMVMPALSSPFVLVLQVWRKTPMAPAIHGVVKLNILPGSFDQSVEVRAITGEGVGWLRLIYGIVADPAELNAEIDRRIAIQPHSEVKPVPLPIEGPVNPPKPAPKEPPPAIEKEPSEQLDYISLYMCVMESIRTSKDRQCKLKTDSLLQKQTVSKEELLELLRMNNPNLSANQLNFFCSRFDYPLSFQQFFNSYLRYCLYQRKIRLNLEELVHLILKHTSPEAIRSKMRKATLYYGYVASPQIAGLLQQAGVQKKLAVELTVYLSDSKHHVFLDSLFEVIQGKRSVHPDVFCNFVRTEMLKTHSMPELEDILRRYRRGEQEDSLAHIECALLQNIQDEAQIRVFARLEDLEVRPQPEPLPIRPTPPREDIIVDPNHPKPSDEISIPERIRKVEVLIASVDCSIATISELLINREICLLGQQLPQVILLPEGESAVVTVHTRQGLVLEGDFIAQNPNVSKIRLFCKGREAGWLHFTQAKPSEVRIDITKKTSKEEPEKRRQADVDEYEPEFRYLNSKRVTLEIVSVVPSGNYDITINSATLKYPIQFSMVLENTKDKNLLTTMSGRHDIKGQCEIRLAQGITKYAVNRADSRLVCLLQVRVSATFGHPKPMPIGLKNLCLFVDRLDSPLCEEQLLRDKFYLLVESDQYTKTKEFSLDGHRSCLIRTTIELKECRQYKISLIGSRRQLVGEFRWSVDFTAELGVHRHEGYLRSGPHRLSVILFEANYNDDFSLLKKGPQKMQPLLKIFTAENLVLMDRELSKGVEFNQIMKNHFRMTHSETHVLEGLIGSKIAADSLFSLRPSTSLRHYAKDKHSLRQLCEQFFLYDFDSQGFVKPGKAELVLQLLYQPDELDINLEEFVPSKQGRSARLIDLNNVDNEQLDYFQLLRHIELQQPADPFFYGGPQKVEENSQEETADQSQLRGKAVRVTLLGYEDLTYRNMPGTYLFKIGESAFADAIPRSFSHKFQEPLPFIQCRYPSMLKVYNKQYSVTQLWKYSQICEVPIEEVTKVLQGKVFFRIQLLDKQADPTAKKPVIEPQRPPAPSRPNQYVPPPKPVQPPPERPARAFPEMTPIKFRDNWQPDTLRKTLNEQDPSHKEELQRFKRIFNQPVDLSKYNFDDSDED